MNRSLVSTPTRMLKAEGSTVVESLAQTASSVFNSDADPAPLGQFDAASALSIALQRADLSHKEAALTMGLDPAQWSRQLHGDGHISFQRLLRLPRAFWQEFLPLLGAPLRVVVASEDGEDAALLRLASVVESFAMLTVRRRALRRIA